MAVRAGRIAWCSATPPPLRLKAKRPPTPMSSRRVSSSWSLAFASCKPEFVADDPAFAGTMSMTWDVAPVDAGTRVNITADDVPEGISAEDHAVGLASSFDEPRRVPREVKETDK